MADMEETFESAGSGAAEQVPVQCSSLRKGGHVVIRDRPCKVVDMSTSKTGKHGHAKVHLTAIDVFTGKKLEELCPSTHSMNVPMISRVEYALLDIDEDGVFLTLMDDAGATREDVALPPDVELANQIKEGFEAEKELIVTVVAAMGHEQVLQWKEAAQKQ